MNFRLGKHRDLLHNLPLWTMSKTAVLKLNEPSNTGPAGLGSAIEGRLEDLVEHVSVHESPMQAVLEAPATAGNQEEEGPWLAVVSHEHGEEVYIGMSRAEVMREVGAYVSEWYQHDYQEQKRIRFQIRKALFRGDYEQAAKVYFKNHIREYCDLRTYSTGSKTRLQEAQDEEAYREELLHAVTGVVAAHGHYPFDTRSEAREELGERSTKALEALYEEVVLVEETTAG